MATQSNTVSNGLQTSQIRQSAHGRSKEVSDFTYEKSDIPQSMIDECENLSLETDEVYFIFDNSVSNLIKKRYEREIDKKREIIIDNMLNTGDRFHIGSSMYFTEMPSRFSYYDTETKETDRYKKYKILTDFLSMAGFTPNTEFNFGPEYDQSYTLSIDDKSFIVRVRPNLFLSIQCGFLSNYHQNIIFNGFFSKSKISGSLKKESPNFTSLVRDIKLDIIL